MSEKCIDIPASLGVASTMLDRTDGGRLFRWMEDLFPVCRSITGQGVRATLSYLKKILPQLQIHSVPSGYKAFDWEVPEEWNISEAYIEDCEGNVVLDIRNNNLHIVSYSTPVDLYLSREELDSHLHSLPELPEAIPYITSYYEKRWGFCLTHIQRMNLKDGTYHVVIKSELSAGILNYGELILPGQTDDEVFVSTYICHPSMANNELSGPCVVAAFADWLCRQPKLHHTYRIIFVPETIGSIVYLSKHLDWMKKHTVAGFNVTCVGDNGSFSYIQSRYGNTKADKIIDYALRRYSQQPKVYSYLERGSDERQYCSPLVNLPVVSIMRSKFGTFPEYHTSLDNLNFVTSRALGQSCDMLINIAKILENDFTYRVVLPCEPQLGKRGLYPTLGSASNRTAVRSLMNLLAYCDGTNSLLDISEIINVDFFECADLINTLVDSDLIIKVQ